MVLRLLSTVAALVLALPPGWCCAPAPVDCCRTTKPAAADPCGKPGAKACCQSHAPAKPTPPAEPPVRPADERCCCERDPAAPAAGKPLLDDTTADSPAAFPRPSAPRIEPRPSGRPFVAQSRSLHCVWLC